MTTDPALAPSGSGNRLKGRTDQIPRSVGPFLGGPISGRVDHSDNHHGFLAVCLGDCVGEDVGQTRHRLLVDACHTSGASCRHIPKGRGRSVDGISHATGSGGVLRRDVGNLISKIAQRITGPANRSLQPVPPAATSIARRTVAIASSWLTVWPAFASASPRSMPSMIASSRST